MSTDNALLAMVQIAVTEAASRVEAAVQAAQIAAGATSDAAKSQANATVSAAQAHANATVGAAQTQATAETTVATTRAQADVEVATIQAEAAKSNAQFNFNGIVQAAQANADATKYAADAHKEGQIAAAQSAADATKSAADSQANAQIESAQAHATATTTAAQTQATAETQVAQINSDATRASASYRLQGDQAQANAQVQAAQAQAYATTSSAVTRANADVQSAQAQAGAQIQAASLNADASKYGSDQQLAGVQSKNQTDITILQKKLDWIDNRWAQVWPSIQDFLNGSGTGGSSARYSDMVNAVGPAPTLTTGPIWTPQQIQQQVNLLYVKADQKAQTLTRTASIDLAGRGFASDSPIMQAIRFANEGFSIAATTESAAKLQIDIAQANADQIIKSAQAAVEVFAKKVEAFSDLEKNAVSLNVGMFQAAAGLLAGVV